MNVIYASKLEEDAKLPTRKHWSDAGADLYALETAVLSPQTSGIIRTGVTIDIPDGYVGILKAKSKSDFIVGAGVVDSGYQGEILVKIFNPYRAPIEIVKGSAIAQLVITPCISGEIQEIPKEEIHNTKSDRGKTGGIATQLSLLEDILSEQEARKFMENKNDTK